jgi:flagellar protein FlaJ
MNKPLRILGLEMNKPKIIEMTIALLIIILSFIFLRDSQIFYFLIGISLLIAGLPFFVSLIIEGNTTKQKDEMFLEFSRSLVESVKAGTPISKSIINIKNKDYGPLSPYINKLANQISLGISLKTAFDTFARDVESPTVSRAVSIISESEKAGGNISEILESVVKSITQVEKLKKERRSSIYTLVVQGYIIFFIFIVIMLVMEFKILPIATGLSKEMAVSGTSSISSSGIGIGNNIAKPEDLARPFLWLLMVQGFFVGLVIGKLSEGNIRSGLKHSFVFLMLALLINTGAKVLIT